MELDLKKKILEKYGSQIRFAHAVGESETVVSKVVRGWRSISQQKQEAWAKALECETKEIFNG